MADEKKPFGTRNPGVVSKTHGALKHRNALRQPGVVSKRHGNIPTKRGRKGLRTGGLQTSSTRVGNLKRSSGSIGAAAHNELVEQVERKTPLPERGWQETPHGMLAPVPSPIVSNYKPGFIVRGSTDGSLTVTVVGDGNIVSGLDDVYIPEIGGISLLTTPSPTLSVDDADWVALKIEIEPGVEEYDTNAWRIIESGFTVVDDKIEVVSQPSVSMTLPTINPTTGAVTQNGIYYVPLALVEVSGSQVTVTHKGYAEKGPIAVRFCATGFLTIMGAIQMRFGSLQTFEDDP